MEEVKAPVTERALVQRINRKLAKEGQQLKAGLGRYKTELGEYYIVDINANTIVAQHCQLIPLAEELGVLKAYELVVEE